MDLEILTDVDPEEFAREAKVSLGKETTCMNCGKKILLSVPAKVGDFKGLTTDHTECGPEFRQFAMAMEDMDTIEALTEIFKELSGGEEPESITRIPSSEEFH